MRKILLLITFIYSCYTFAQVGIGTQNPQASLDVNGSMLVQGTFEVGTLPVVTNTDQDFKLLTRLTTPTAALEGEITVLDVDNLTVAPINVINYSFTNLQSDNLTDVDLQYSSSDYIVGLSNFQYIGDPVSKQTGTNSNSIGTFVMRTYEAPSTIDPSINTWHLEIRNRFLDTELSGSVSYKVTFIVYDKSFFKKLDTITTDLNGKNTGTASSIPDLAN